MSRNSKAEIDSFINYRALYEELIRLKKAIKGNAEHRSFQLVLRKIRKINLSCGKEKELELDPLNWIKHKSTKERGNRECDYSVGAGGECLVLINRYEDKVIKIYPPSTIGSWPFRIMDCPRANSGNPLERIDLSFKKADINELRESFQIFDKISGCTPRKIVDEANGCLITSQPKRLTEKCITEIEIIDWVESQAGMFLQSNLSSEMFMQNWKVDPQAGNNQPLICGKDGTLIILGDIRSKRNYGTNPETERWENLDGYAYPVRRKDLEAVPALLPAAVGIEEKSEVRLLEEYQPVLRAYKNLIRAERDTGRGFPLNLRIALVREKMGRAEIDRMTPKFST